MMGNQNQIEGKSDDLSKEDPDNITVVIEKDQASKISDSAEGTFILPKKSNCVKIADLIFSIVKSPITLYLGGQDFTHNYTQLGMLENLMEDGYLNLIYSERIKFAEDCTILEDYVTPKEFFYQGPPRIKVKPLSPPELQKIKIVLWDECTIRQFSLILCRILKVERVQVYHNKKLVEDGIIIRDMRKFEEIDGIIHLDYKLA